VSPHNIVSNNNRWSRITLNFDGVEPDAWCEFSFQLERHPHEENRSVHDFAVVGVDFLTEDGSSIDFAYVPGLARTQVDPHSCYVSGPDYRERNGKSHRVSIGFFMPSPARKLAVNIRSWRNSHPFTISDPKLLQVGAPQSADTAISEGVEQANRINTVRPLNARHSWRSLHVEPTWFRFAIPSGRNLLVRGQIINERLAPEGALARVVYRDATGEKLPPPYPEMMVAPSVGAFIDIPVHQQARRFTLDLVPPQGAASVEIGFQTWNAQTRMELVTPLEVSLEDDLWLEAISGSDLPDAPTFLKRLMDRLGVAHSFEPPPGADLLEQLLDPKALASLSTFHDKLDAVQHGKKAMTSEDGLALGTFPSWPLPDKLQWTEDPYQSLAWRLEFQSLAWLYNLVEEKDPKSLTRIIDLAASWSQANPWGHPSDTISAHPRALSARAETLLRLLSLSVKAPHSSGSRNTLIILAETVRHAFAMAQILGQNVFSHSIVHIHMACTLLALARALPHVPLAPYWISLALAHLRDGFRRMVDENGTFAEQSLHAQLELVSLGLILVRQLESMPETSELRDDLTERLRKGLRTLVAVTAPSGSLPPFGDAPYGFHHASWLRRLLSGYGTNLLSDPDLATELSYPPGKKVFSSARCGLVAARCYERNTQWSYFCASLSSRHHEHDHYDCTSFVYSTGGASWIVDPRGSHLHETGIARQYLAASRAHNVALPDDREQLAGLGWIEAHEELEGATVFKIGSNVYGPAYEHHRIFMVLDRLDAIAVCDHFTTSSEAVTFEGLLHFDADIVAAIANTQLGVAYRKSEKLRVIPYTVNGSFSGMSVENGRNDPPGTVQGFVADPTGRLQPANVLRYRFSGQKTVCGGVVLAVNDQAARSLSRLLETEAVRKLLQRHPGGHP
jgi:hypothetical protein